MPPFSSVTEENANLQKRKTLGTTRRKSGCFPSGFKSHSFDVLHNVTTGSEVITKEITQEELDEKQKFQLILWQSEEPDENVRIYLILLDYNLTNNISIFFKNI